MGGGGVEEKKAKERRNRIWEPFPLSPVPLLFLGDFPCGVVSGVVLRLTESGSEESERFHFLPTRSVYDFVADCRSGKHKRKDNPITLTFPRFVIDWFSSSDFDDPVFT